MIDAEDTGQYVWNGWKSAIVTGGRYYLVDGGYTAV